MNVLSGVQWQIATVLLQRQLQLEAAPAVHGHGRSEHKSRVKACATEGVPAWVGTVPIVLSFTWHYPLLDAGSEEMQEGTAQWANSHRKLVPSKASTGIRILQLVCS